MVSQTLQIDDGGIEAIHALEDAGALRQLADALRRERQDRIAQRQRLIPLLLVQADGLEVAEHTDRDVRRRGNGKMLRLQLGRCAEQRPQTLRAVALAEQLSGERIDQNAGQIVVGVAHDNEEVAWKVHPVDTHAGTSADLDIRQRQRDRNAVPARQHDVQVAALRIVETIPGAAQARATVQHFDQRRGLGLTTVDRGESHRELGGKFVQPLRHRSWIDDVPIRRRHGARDIQRRTAQRERLQPPLYKWIHLPFPPVSSCDAVSCELIRCETLSCETLSCDTFSCEPFSCEPFS